MLANMFSGELVPGIQDEQGAYMLDRTPKYFEPILNYLRTKELVIDPNVSMDGVLGEARYFGIQSLVDQIEKLKLAEEQKKSDVLHQPQVVRVDGLMEVLQQLQYTLSFK